MKFSILLLFTLLLAGAISDLCATALVPPNIPEFKLMYDYSRREDISTPGSRLEHNIAPYMLNTTGLKNAVAARQERLNAEKVLLYLFPSVDFRAAEYSRGRDYKSARGGFIAAPSEKIYILTDYFLDEKLAKDPDYTGHKWRGFAGEVENAFIFYGGHRVEIMAGRFSSNWGPEGESLILSSTARPMDAVSARLKWGRLFFSSQFGQLQRFASPDSIGAFDNRYFSAHRLDIRLSNNFNVGLFESAIYGGKGRNFEISYINPLMFFHSIQLNDNVDDNTLFGADFTYFIRNRHKIYGQLLIDDYQIDHKESSDNEPNEIGILLGFHSLNIFNFLDLKGEYLRINNRVYNQFLSRNRYVNRGELIGNNFGPDGDRCSLSAEKWLQSENRVSFGVSYRRKGEGRYNDKWRAPWLFSGSDYDEPFPTGVVEKKFAAEFGFEGYPNKYIFVDANAGIEHIVNFAHMENDDRTNPFISIRLSFLLGATVRVQ